MTVCTRPAETATTRRRRGRFLYRQPKTIHQQGNRQQRPAGSTSRPMSRPQFRRRKPQESFPSSSSGTANPPYPSVNRRLSGRQMSHILIITPSCTTHVVIALFPRKRWLILHSFLSTSSMCLLYQMRVAAIRLDSRKARRHVVALEVELRSARSDAHECNNVKTAELRHDDVMQLYSGLFQRENRNDRPV